MPGKFTVRSISKRFIILTIIMVIVLFGSLGVFIVGQQEESLRTALKSKSTSVANLANHTGVEYMVNFNFIALDHLVEDICLDPEVAFVGFYNNKKELVTKLPIPKNTAGLQVVEQPLKDHENTIVGSVVIGYKQDAVRKSLYQSIAFVAAGTVIAIFLFSLGISLTSRRLILAPIHQLSVITAQVSSGDLSQKIDVTTDDEFGRFTVMLNGMIENLNQMVGQINTAAGALNHIAGDLAGTCAKVVDAANLQSEGVNETSSAIIEINASIKGVAHNVELLAHSAAESSSSILEMTASVSEVSLNTDTLSQTVASVSSSIAEMAASIKQVESGVYSLQSIATSTASSILEMDASIRQVEKNAANAAAISESVLSDAELGRAAVEASIVGMKEIKRSSDITSEVINCLSQRTSDIGVILSVIDEVAEQTNLLALNAAIIAAQAGEHGKGFAVVADEIKELAERTQASTQEITQVIKGVQSETSRAVEAIHLAETSIAEGKELSEKSGAALSKIYAGVQTASQQMREIARTTLEQSKGSQMIRDAMEQVSAMVNQIAMATREQSMGSDLILTSTERMNDLTEQVRKSTFEQNKVGNVIALTTESITDMIAQINRACEEQSHGSEKITYAVENIQSSALMNVDATKEMDKVIANLFLQIEVLKNEMGIFKV